MIELLVFAYLIAVSYIVHEYAHAFTAKAIGCSLIGWHFQLPLAVGYIIDLRGRSARLVAAGGLLATASLAMIGAALAPNWIGVTLLYFNAVLFLCNAIPLRGADGYLVLRGWRS